EQRMKDQNINAALRYFEELKLRPYTDGLAEIRFLSAKENFTLFFIPFAEPAPKVGLEHIALFAESPKGSMVHLATISAPPNEPPVLKDEKVAIDGKVQPGNEFMRNWLKCS